MTALTTAMARGIIFWFSVHLIFLNIIFQGSLEEISANLAQMSTRLKDKLNRFWWSKFMITVTSWLSILLDMKIQKCLNGTSTNVYLDSCVHLFYYKFHLLVQA